MAEAPCVAERDFPSAPLLEDVDLMDESSMEIDTYQDTKIFFDWDDTLMPSTTVRNKLQSQNFNDNSNWKFELEILEKIVIDLLTTASKYGQIYIVTNGETGWVELSAELYMPKVLPMLKNITVISARSMYENAFPDDPLQWKIEAFTRIFNETCLKPNSQWIAMGDSHVDRRAFLTLKNILGLTCKNLKLIETPTIPQLIRELQLIKNTFGNICQADGNLDLQMQLGPEEKMNFPQFVRE